MNILIREMEAVIQSTTVPRRENPIAANTAGPQAPDTAMPEPRIPDEPRLGALELRSPSVAPQATGAGPRRREG